jgi:hypothetical protein
MNGPGRLIFFWFFIVQLFRFREAGHVQVLLRRERVGVHHGPKGQSELRSLGQAEAYPIKSPAFRMWRGPAAGIR